MKRIIYVIAVGAILYFALVCVEIDSQADWKSIIFTALMVGVIAGMQFLVLRQERTAMWKKMNSLAIRSFPNKAEEYRFFEDFLKQEGVAAREVFERFSFWATEKVSKGIFQERLNYLIFLKEMYRKGLLSDFDNIVERTEDSVANLFLLRIDDEIPKNFNEAHLPKIIANLTFKTQHFAHSPGIGLAIAQVWFERLKDGLTVGKRSGPTLLLFFHDLQKEMSNSKLTGDRWKITCQIRNFLWELISGEEFAHKSSFMEKLILLDCIEERHKEYARAYIERNAA